jgi:hypothetical protein
MVDPALNDSSQQNPQGQQPDGRRRNPADNLSRQDRIRGGARSAAMQNRDGRGKFSGRRSGNPEKGRDELKGDQNNGNNSGDSGSSGGRDAESGR